MTFTYGGMSEKILEGKHRVGSLRYGSFKLVLDLMEKRDHKVLVETGTSRGGLNSYSGDGGSTIIFSQFAMLRKAKLYSVDISKRNVEKARQAVDDFKPYVEVVCSDSIQYLNNFKGKIDFLYLDSYDFDQNNPEPSQTHHLKEIKAAYKNLTDSSVIMIDDCALAHGGKGKKVLEFLDEKGWKIVYKGYQIVLVRN